MKCYYTLPGNYTFKLSITTNAPQHSRMTGLYSADLTVLGGRIIIITYHQCSDLTIYIVATSGVNISEILLFCRCHKEH